MFGLALLSVSLHKPQLLVVRLENLAVRFLVMDAIGGTTREIHSHPFGFDTSNTELAYLHNLQLQRGTAIALDRERRRIAYLAVVGYPKPSKTGEPDIPWHWPEEVELGTLDYDGRPLRKARALIMGDDDIHLGFGKDGNALLVARRESGAIETNSGAGWIATTPSELPPSFVRAVLSPSADPKTIALVNDSPVFFVKIYASPAWTHIDFPGLSSPYARDVCITVDGSRGTVAYDSRKIAVRWGKRGLSAAYKNGFWLSNVFPLDYPCVVGRTSREVMSGFDAFWYKLNPYLDSVLWSYDLATQKAKPLTKGLYALSM